MSSGGSQVTAATPWSAASPYLTDIMGKAQSLYGSLAPQYMNPASNFGYGQTTGAVGNVIGGTTPFGSMATSLAPGTTQAIQQQLSGTPDYTAVKGALDAANQQTWNSFNNQELPQLNQRASFLGNPSGAIKDLNWATSQIGQNMDLNAQQQYLQQYNLAKQQQANAAGLGANIAQGAGAQTLQGANLFGSLSQLPQSNLADYANIVGSTGGKFGTSTSNMNAGAAGTAANVIGGLTAGAGLLNSVFGTGGASGSLASGIGSLLGGGAGTAIDTTAASDAAMAGLGSSTAAQGAGVASGVEAANDAYLAGSGAGAAAGAGTAAGAGLGAGLGEPALASAGVDAVAPTAEIAGLGSGGAAGSGAAGSTAAGLGGAAGALSIAALPAILAATVQEHPFDAAYNARMLQGLNAPVGSDAYNQATQQMIAMYAAGYPHMDQLAPEVLQRAQAIGLDKAGAQMRTAAQIAQGTPGARYAAGKTYGVSRNQY